MTEKEYHNLKIGDVVYDITKKIGYLVTAKDDGHIEYDGVPWNGSIPKRHLLEWDLVVLTKHDDFTENENVKKSVGMLKSIIDQPSIAEEENRYQLWSKIWKVINLLSNESEEL